MMWGQAAELEKKKRGEKSLWRDVAYRPRYLEFGVQRMVVGVWGVISDELLQVRPRLQHPQTLSEGNCFFPDAAIQKVKWNLPRIRPLVRIVHSIRFPGCGVSIHTLSAVATLTIRVIKSFPYRTYKAVVLHGLDLGSLTVEELKEKVRSGMFLQSKTRIVLCLNFPSRRDPT
jgi:hypothetical protein